MKKATLIFLCATLIFGVTLYFHPQEVNAESNPLNPTLAPTSIPTSIPTLIPTPTPILWVAESTFVTESDTRVPSAPTAGWQPVTDAIVIESAGVIAAPCPGARYGWYCKIFQLTASKTWAPLETTTGWAPTTEGRIMSAAYAPAAGKYAIFNMYVGDALTECEVEFRSAVVNMTQGFCLSD